MIERIGMHYFKRFQEETFDLSDSIILAGPNNTGKTTLLQGIAVWHLALRKWLTERGPESRSKAKQRTGVAITRKDFTAIPLREMNLLWTDCSTALLKDELKEEQRLGTPRILSIKVNGAGLEGKWSLSFEFSYQNSELIYVRPAEGTTIEEHTPIYRAVKDLQVVHVPPFSGIGAEETRYDRAYQDLLIGQGKAGDLLRNLLLEVHKQGQDRWDELCKNIMEIFGYELLPPLYEGRPFIVCDYKPGIRHRTSSKNLPKLDIACAGSGFLQVLMLLGFFYARPASILLLDEPDAHLHVILQKQVYDHLRDIARRRSCQLLIATHSEVLIDGTSPERIVSFFQRPHKLVSETHRDQVREALKRLTSLDLLKADEAQNVLYVEDESSLDLLREWAIVLNHQARHFLNKPFCHINQGRDLHNARAHFFALKAIRTDIRGVLILDGDNRRLPDRELSADGLTILRWKRYETENYLVHPEALNRFIVNLAPPLFMSASASKGWEYLKKQIPPTVFDNPLSDHEYLDWTPASKTLLPKFFEAAGIQLSKKEYYQIAKQMKPEEIPPEIKEKLDAIYTALELDRKISEEE